MSEVELEIERQRLARLSSTELLAEVMAMIERNQQTEEGRAYLAETAEFWANHIGQLRRKAAAALRRDMAAPAGRMPSR